MERELVSFGNFLLKSRFLGVVKDSEPTSNKEVTHADLCNWKQYEGVEGTYLISRYKIGDLVTIDLYDSGIIREAKVIKIHFTESKVLYDVEICIKKSPAGEKHNMYTRLYNLDSLFIKDYIV